ncbi:MAG: hypothetical protein ACRD3E_11855 [Terriglobales bacterium]
MYVKLIDLNQLRSRETRSNACNGHLSATSPVNPRWTWAHAAANRTTIKELFLRDGLSQGRPRIDHDEKGFAALFQQMELKLGRKLLPEEKAAARLSIPTLQAPRDVDRRKTPHEPSDDEAKAAD